MSTEDSTWNYAGAFILQHTAKPYEHFYMWTCKRCGYREATIENAPPDVPCALCLRLRPDKEEE